MNLQISITNTIMHGNSWNKAQINQHWKMNNNSITISWIKEMSSMTSWRCRTGIDGFRPWKAQTDLLKHLYGWMDEELKFKCARFHSNLDLPWMKCKLRAWAIVHGSSWFLLQIYSITLPDDEWIKRNGCYVKKLREIFESKICETWI